MARGFLTLYKDGIVVDGELFYFCLTGVKGDAEFHVDAGEFIRSYMNVGHVNNLEMCSECLADDNFADVSDHPVWLPSVPWMGSIAYGFSTCQLRLELLFHGIPLSHLHLVSFPSATFTRRFSASETCSTL